MCSQNEGEDRRRPGHIPLVNYTSPSSYRGCTLQTQNRRKGSRRKSNTAGTGVMSFSEPSSTCQLEDWQGEERRFPSSSPDEKEEAEANAPRSLKHTSLVLIHRNFGVESKRRQHTVSAALRVLSIVGEKPVCILTQVPLLAQAGRELSQAHRAAVWPFSSSFRLLARGACSLVIWGLRVETSPCLYNAKDQYSG